MRTDGVMPYMASTIVIQPRASVGANRLMTTHATLSASVLQEQKALNGTTVLQVLGLPAGVSVSDACKNYEASGLVDFAEPNYVTKICDDDNTSITGTIDPFIPGGLQYNLFKIHAIDSFNKFYSGANIPLIKTNLIIAVCDTGMRTTHHDFQNNGVTSELWTNPNPDPNLRDVNGFNYVSNNNNINDDNGHGTFVAGVAAARGRNGVGISGVCIKAKIMPIKVAASNGYATSANIASGIRYAVDHGASVINVSLGQALPAGVDINNYDGKPFSGAVYKAIQYAQQRNILVVVAAGNGINDNGIGINLVRGSVGQGGTNVDEFPATYNLDNIIVVGATNQNDALTPFSNYGVKVHLSAPGKDIVSLSTPNDDAYAQGDGTSFAAPEVAAVVCLLRANYPNEDYHTTFQRLLQGVDVTTPGLTATGGRLNMYNVLPH